MVSAADVAIMTMCGIHADFFDIQLRNSVWIYSAKLCASWRLAITEIPLPSMALRCVTLLVHPRHSCILLRMNCHSARRWLAAVAVGTPISFSRVNVMYL